MSQTMTFDRDDEGRPIAVRLDGVVRDPLVVCDRLAASLAAAQTAELIRRQKAQERVRMSRVSEGEGGGDGHG